MFLEDDMVKGSMVAREINFEEKDKVRDHIISLEHISTKKLLANLLTKGLPPNVLREHLADMGLRESL